MSDPSAPSALDHIGHLIRKRRTRRGISQVELARRADIAQGHISEIEAGDKLPSLHALERICRAMGASMGDLLAEAEDLAHQSRVYNMDIDTSSGG